MNASLEEHVAIVTGASSGLGERFVRTLTAHGASVIATARRSDRLDALAGEVGGAVVPLAGDVTDREMPTRAVEIALERFGRIDILVNNAGVNTVQPATEESVESFSRTLQINLVAPFAWAQAACSPMIAAGGGSIVNVSSALGLVGIGRVPQAGYCASKGGLLSLTRELAAQWARDGVRVNALAPGWFPTEMTGEHIMDERFLRYIHRTVPAGRPGTLEELDGALLFLAGRDSTYVTGQTIVVDGGWTSV